MKKNLFFLSIISFFGFHMITREKSENDLVVELTHKAYDEEFFLDSDYYYTSIKIGALNRYTNYSKYLKENYKGVPENDSVSFYRCLEDRFMYKDIYNLGDFSKEDEQWYLSHKDLDTLNLSKVQLKSTLIIVIGFNKDKQFIIADVNKNKDFSDDIKYEYDIHFRNNSENQIDILNKQPISAYSYEDCQKGFIQKYDRRFILYPDRNNRFSISDRINPNKEREYFSILKFRDYWKGEATVDDEKIDFIFHGYRNNYGILIVKPRSVKYENSTQFESQYFHKYYGDSGIDDTISINDRKYRIDSISRTISKIYLRAVGKRNHFGYEVGNYISNVEFKDLKYNSFSINSIIGEKKYTLLEFWGTWCGPCVAMTPKLIDAKNKYSSKLNIVSIAVDDNIEKVKTYTKKHHLNWKLGFIPRKNSYQNKLLNQLKIKFYPTFILMDSKGKIIDRGFPEHFDEMMKKVK